ncbi:MAG TPA: hypothetical protein VEE86_02430 [Thermoplasmata archaeon]|nr:hypothetical protein [Thermoplasmata archaeon]
MHSYVDLYFTPESVSPLEISDRLRSVAGLSFILGPHDLVFEWSHETEFRERLTRIHDALRGTGILYRVETVADEPGFIAPLPWPPPMPRRDPVHPGF